MSTIKKSDIVEDKDIIKAFNDINEAIKAVSKSVIDSANDFAKLQASVRSVKGFDELYKAQKKYNDLQNDTIKSQKLLADLDAKKQKLNEATAKAVIADNNRIIKSEEAKAAAIAKSLSDESKLRESNAKALKAERQASEQLLIADRNLLKETERLAKQAEKAAKDLAKETSLYAQKSKALNEQRAAAKELGLQYGVNSKQFQNAAKEVNKLDAELKNLDASLGQHQRNVGHYEKVWNLAIAGWAAGGAALATAATYLINLNSNFEKASSSLRAITGASLQDMQFYEAAAKSMGSSMGVAGDEMLKSFERVGSIRPELLKMKEALVEVTESAIILSQASGGMLDLAGATESLGAGMNQFNLTAKDSSRIINTLAAGSQAGSAEVSSLAESFKTVGAVADNANMSLEDTVAALEVLGEKSLYGSEAGTKLRGTILKLQEAGKGFTSGKFNLKDALTETKAQFDAIANPIDRATYLQKMFGIENQTAGIIMLNNIEKYTQFQTAVTGTNVAFEQQKIQMDNLSGSATRFGVAWDNLWNRPFVTKSIKWAVDFGTAIIEMTDFAKASNDDLVATMTHLEKQGLTTSKTIEVLQAKLKTLEKERGMSKGDTLFDVYANKIEQLKKGMQDQSDALVINSERQELAKKTVLELSVASAELSNKLKEQNKEYGLQIVGLGGLEKVSQGEIALTKLKIRAIDEEVAARKKAAEEPSGKLGLSEAQLKANEEAAKKTEARRKKELDDFKDAETKINKEKARAFGISEEQSIKFFDRQIGRKKTTVEIEADIEKRALADMLKLKTDNQKKIDEQDEKEKNQYVALQETKKKVAQDAWNTSKDLVDTMFEIEQNNYDKEAKRIEDKYDLQENTLKKQLDNDKLTVESRNQIEGQLKAIEAKKAEELKAIEAKKRESQRKQFIINKAIAVAEIAMTTAQAVMKTYSEMAYPWAVPLAIAVGAIGAVQAGLVLAQPIPEFDKGTESAPNGQFMVGEKGPEFMVHKGETQLITEPTVMNNKAGARVVSTIDTAKILQSNQKDKVWTSFGKGPSIENSRLIDATEETNRLLRSQKQVKIFVSGNVSSYAEIGNARIKQTFRG